MFTQPEWIKQIELQGIIMNMQFFEALLKRYENCQTLEELKELQAEGRPAKVLEQYGYILEQDLLNRPCGNAEINGSNCFVMEESPINVLYRTYNTQGIVSIMPNKGE